MSVRLLQTKWGKRDFLSSYSTQTADSLGIKQVYSRHFSTKFHQDLPNNWGARSIPRCLGFHDFLDSYLKISLFSLSFIY